LRPLLRRAARMARPARVRMRSRNPWVRDRRRLFGWKVRLLTGGSPGTGSPSSRPRRRPASRPQRPVYRRTARRTHPTPRGRPYKATHPRSGGSIRVPVTSARLPVGDTPRTLGCLLANTSCGIARRLLACVLLVGQMGVGALLRRASYVGPSAGVPLRFAVPSCTVVDNPVDASRFVGARPSPRGVGGSGWVGGLDMTNGRRGEGSS
jgi:hypothetical protein